MNFKYTAYILILITLTCCHRINQSRNISTKEVKHKDFNKIDFAYIHDENKYKTDSSFISVLNNEALSTLKATVNNSNIVKTTDSNTIKILNNYYKEKENFYDKYPLENIENSKLNLNFACKYLTGDLRILSRVRRIINSKNKDSIIYILKKFNSFVCFRYNKISDNYLSDFLVNSLQNPNFEEYVIPLIPYINKKNNIKILENHLIKANEKNKTKIIHSLVQNNSELGFNALEKIIYKKKDSLLINREYREILYLIDSNFFGEKINESNRNKMSSIIINNCYYPFLKKFNTNKKLSNILIKVYKTYYCGEIRESHLSELIERSDKSIIPFLLELRTYKNKLTKLNINFINFHLLKLGFSLNKKDINGILKDDYLIRYMCNKNIIIHEIINSDSFYKSVFKDYISGNSAIGRATRSNLLTCVLPYFKSTDTFFFENQILNLIEKNNDVLPLFVQEENARKIITFQKKMKKNEIEILNFYKKSGFLSTKESIEVKKRLIKEYNNDGMILFELYQVLRQSGKTVTLKNSYKRSLTSLKKFNCNKIIKDFRFLIIDNSKKNVSILSIIFNDKIYSIDTNKYLIESSCVSNRFATLINFIFEDNTIKNKLINFTENDECYQSFYIGQQKTLDKIINDNPY